MSTVQAVLGLIVFAVVVVAALYFFAPSVFARIKARFQKRSEPSEPQPRPPVIVDPVRPTRPTATAAPPLFNGFAIDWPLFRGEHIAKLAVRVGRGLTDQEIELARSRGVLVPEDPAPTGTVDRSGNDLGVGGGHVLVGPFIAGRPMTFTFQVKPGQSSFRFAVMGSPGRVFRTAQGSIDGGPAQEFVGNVDAILDIGPVLTPGPHTISIVVDRDSQNGVQYNQWAQ